MKRNISIFQEKTKILQEIQERESRLNKEKENRDQLASKIKVILTTEIFLGTCCSLKSCLCICKCLNSTCKATLESLWTLEMKIRQSWFIQKLS